jgi:imidazolonepropionase-like amidohydrolase
MPPLVLRAPIAWLGPGRLSADVQVICEGGVIQEVGRVHPVPAEAEVLSVGGFLMPAAADRHVHIGLSDPAAVLRRGVTAVRDLGWPPDHIFPMADASELSSFKGPLVLAAGPMLTAPGGYPAGAPWAPEGTARELDGPQDAAAAVGELAVLGATAVKVSLNAEAGPTPTDAELASICDAAHAADLMVTAHAQGGGQVERALGAGVDELAHTPWTQRLSEELITAAASRMRIVSTLDIHSFGRDTPALHVALDNLRRFHEAGGEVVYGTDLGNGPIPAGIDTHELELLAAAGLAADEVLQALVRAPLEPGAPADLVALDDGPMEDLRAFEHIRLVVRAGSVVFRT